ncbi:spore protein [Oceanobacillus massiliensis]
MRKSNKNKETNMKNQHEKSLKTGDKKLDGPNRPST